MQSKINYKVNFHSKATEISPEDVTKTPVMKRDSRTGDEEEAGQSARRPSPDGAECEDINTSGVECGIKVDRLVPGTEVRTGVGCSVGTPSGVLANCNYWIWDDGTEGLLSWGGVRERVSQCVCSRTKPGCDVVVLQ